MIEFRVSSDDKNNISRIYFRIADKDLAARWTFYISATHVKCDNYSTSHWNSEITKRHIVHIEQELLQAKQKIRLHVNAICMFHYMYMYTLLDKISFISLRCVGV